jgi:hypothetical protein
LRGTHSAEDKPGALRAQGIRAGGGADSFLRREFERPGDSTAASMTETLNTSGS